jgi:hypothetical protein
LHDRADDAGDVVVVQTVAHGVECFVARLAQIDVGQHAVELAGDGLPAELARAFLQGYERDAQKNARQACRLAVARAASGDGDGAAGLIDSIGSAVPSEVMRELAAEVEMTLDGGLKASVYPARSAAACEAALAAVRRYTS